MTSAAVDWNPKWVVNRVIVPTTIAIHVRNGFWISWALALAAEIHLINPRVSFVFKCECSACLLRVTFLGAAWANS